MAKMGNKTVVFRHMLFWLIFISYELAYLHFTVGLQATFFHFVIYYLLNIGLFYFNAYVILDFAFFRTVKPYLISIALILLELAGYLAIKFTLDLLLSNNPKSHTDQLKHTELYVITNIWRAIYFIGLSIAYWSMLSFLRVRERNHQIETEQLKTLAKNLELENKYMSVENAYLQNQISPHLLFNSLNFIYTAVRGLSENAGKGVTRLSELMRYSLVSADDSRTVLLTEEVAQLENLVELCRMRFENEFFLRFSKKGRMTGIRIIPLILITLVENMMKHGDLGEKQSPARITLEARENTLFFETRNVKRNTSLYPKGGMGLKNIEKRLNNYYQNRYALQTRDVENLFTVTLTLTDL
jgi:two-component system LytT family sensor kinase